VRQILEIGVDAMPMVALMAICTGFILAMQGASELRRFGALHYVIDLVVGLPMEKMDQIFSAFFTTKPQGSGMGLAISRSIVESHGGQLWASSNTGGGATFHFTLPIQVTESSPLVA
jgi:nitrogen-specific signal transduction histidine kinase